MGIRGNELKSLIIQGAIPHATVTFVYAQMYDIFPQYAATVVTLGTLMSFPSIFACYAIVSAMPWLD